MSRIKLNSTRRVAGKMLAAGTELEVGKDITGQDARDLVGNSWATLIDAGPTIQNGDPGAPGSGVVVETRGRRGGKSGN